jgi:hypothetical protein
MPKKSNEKKTKVKKPARDVNVSQTVHVHVTKRRAAPRNANPFQGVRSGNPMHQFTQPMPYANQFSSFVPRSGGPPHNLIAESPFAPVRASAVTGVQTQAATRSVGVGPDAFHPRLSPESLYPRVGAIDLPSSVPQRADAPQSIRQVIQKTNTQPIKTLQSHTFSDEKEEKADEKEENVLLALDYNPYYKQQLANTGFLALPSTNPDDWLYGNYPANHFHFSEFNVENPFSGSDRLPSIDAQIPQSALALEYRPESALALEYRPEKQEVKIPPSALALEYRPEKQELPMATAAASASLPETLLQQKHRLFRELDRKYTYEPLKQYMRSVGLAPGKKDRSKGALLARLVDHLFAK